MCQNAVVEIPGQSVGLRSLLSCEFQGSNQVIRIGNKSLHLLSHLLAPVGAFSLHFFIKDGVDYYFVCFWLWGIFVFVLDRIISCSLLLPFYIGNF